jgi:hypothetical protein
VSVRETQEERGLLDTIVVSAVCGKEIGPHIDFRAERGPKRSLAETDLFMPLLQGDGTGFFGNLRGRFDCHSNREGRLGVGLRRMAASGGNLRDTAIGVGVKAASNTALGGELLGPTIGSSRAARYFYPETRIFACWALTFRPRR